MARLNRNFLAWIGPYPYNPTLIFLFFTFAFFLKSIEAITNAPVGLGRWLAALAILLLSALPSGLFALYAFLIQKYRRWPSNLLTYVCEVAAGQALGVFFAPLMLFVLERNFGFSFVAAAALKTGGFIGSLVLVLFAFALMHRAERSILNRLKYADLLVKKLESDRAELVKADEELRKQTSRFLHDRVQSDLMVVGMKLKTIAGKSSAEVNETINAAIARLENTRTADLRNLVEVLAPNFEANSFAEALQILADQYRSTMKISISVDDASSKLDPKVLLGAFRIVEQALLNSLVHGPASHVQVSIAVNQDGVTRVCVSDDGPGASSAIENSGVGTAVIDSWVSILNGVKNIESVPGHGYLIAVEIAPERIAPGNSGKPAETSKHFGR